MSKLPDSLCGDLCSLLHLLLVLLVNTLTCVFIVHLPAQVANYTRADPYYRFFGAFTGTDVLKVQYLLNKLMHEFINV